MKPQHSLRHSGSCCLKLTRLQRMTVWISSTPPCLPQAACSRQRQAQPTPMPQSHQRDHHGAHWELCLPTWCTRLQGPRAPPPQGAPACWRTTRLLRCCSPCSDCQQNNVNKSEWKMHSSTPPPHPKANLTSPTLGATCVEHGHRWTEECRTPRGRKSTTPPPHQR